MLTVPANLSELSNVDKNVSKNIVYNKVVTKVNAIDTKIPALFYWFPIHNIFNTNVISKKRMTMLTKR